MNEETRNVNLGATCSLNVGCQGNKARCVRNHSLIEANSTSRTRSAGHRIRQHEVQATFNSVAQKCTMDQEAELVDCIIDATM